MLTMVTFEQNVGNISHRDMIVKKNFNILYLGFLYTQSVVCFEPELS